VKPTASQELAIERDDRIADVFRRERARLARFIRRRIRDPQDAEDVVQDVFSRLVEANRLLMPIDHLTGWLFQVARNRITDLFRKQQAESLSGNAVAGQDDDLGLDDFLPSPDAGPEAILQRHRLLEELERAIDELPADQRTVFIAHEIEGRTFKELSAATGVNVKTLLTRKHRAVRQLRRRLHQTYDQFTKT
jgi:RNA polymerase sigma factor (sigma-70 family)